MGSSGTKLITIANAIPETLVVTLEIENVDVKSIKKKQFRVPYFVQIDTEKEKEKETTKPRCNVELGATIQFEVRAKKYVPISIQADERNICEKYPLVSKRHVIVHGPSGKGYISFAKNPKEWIDEDGIDHSKDVEDYEKHLKKMDELHYKQNQEKEDKNEELRVMDFRHKRERDDLEQNFKYLPLKRI